MLSITGSPQLGVHQCNPMNDSSSWSCPIFLLVLLTSDYFSMSIILKCKKKPSDNKIPLILSRKSFISKSILYSWRTTQIHFICQTTAGDPISAYDVVKSVRSSKLPLDGKIVPTADRWERIGLLCDCRSLNRIMRQTCWTICALVRNNNFSFPMQMNNCTGMSRAGRENNQGLFKKEKEKLPM